jgi:hypothetical protein
MHFGCHVPQHALQNSFFLLLLVVHQAHIPKGITRMTLSLWSFEGLGGVAECGRANEGVN